jgi:hypothetical protein
MIVCGWRNVKSLDGILGMTQSIVLRNVDRSCDKLFAREEEMEKWKRRKTVDEVCRKNNIKIN